jgi:prostaglandin-endoperoxide synthase 2
MLENVPEFALRGVIALAHKWPWLATTLNSTAINEVVGVSRFRPHPWSTAHDYVSWTSLSDQHFSARHLPAFTYAHDLPDIKDVTGLFQRKDGEQRLCEKSTCLFPAFAQYLTDGFIRTRMPDKSKHETDDLRRQNTSNHQIDLCPLYGRTSAQTDALRLKSNVPGEKGRLKTQTIAGEDYAPFLFEADGSVKKDFDVLDPPLGLDGVADDRRQRIFAFGGDRTNSVPQVAMMNTLFLREHNRLAGRLEDANKGWDDERVFQTARMIVIVIFLKIVVEEYINHIAPTPYPFVMDAVVSQRAPWNRPNWITTEFSLLYRWHSLLPDEIVWGGTPHKIRTTFMNNDLLIQSGLGGAFSELSEQRTGRLGAFNTAQALIPMEESAILQARTCKVAPYAHYCKYVSRKEPDTFQQITSDRRVIDLLKDLYETPGEVEFYPGLFAEDPAKNSPLPPLILRMVAVDAFSQALTNPLLSENVYKEEAFTSLGWSEIKNTRSLSQLVERNIPAGTSLGRIAMTREGWSYAW